MKFLNLLIGFFVGTMNSLLGAGGGMLVVPTLKAEGLNQKEAQATAIAVILPLTVISAVMYVIKSHSGVMQSVGFLPFGIIGGIIGAKLLPKISSKALNIAFGLFMIYSAVRMFLK